MEIALSFIARLVIGLFGAVFLGLVGFTAGVLAIPPAQWTDGPLQVLRVELIGAGGGIAGSAAWVGWMEGRRRSLAMILLAFVGGLGGAASSFLYVDLGQSNLSFLERAQVATRSTVVLAAVGGNLLPAGYIVLDHLFARRWRVR